MRARPPSRPGTLGASAKMRTWTNMGASTWLDSRGWSRPWRACLIAVAILAVEGYYGYAAVTFAVAASAALNLYLRGPPAQRSGSRGCSAAPSEHLSRPHPVLGFEVDQHVAPRRAARRSGPGVRERSGVRPRARSPRGTGRGGRLPPGPACGSAARGSRPRRAARTPRSRPGSCPPRSAGSAWSTSTHDRVSRRTPVTTIAAARSSATTGSIHWAPVISTSASPTRTAADVSASVPRCAASPLERRRLRCARAATRITARPRG